MCNVTGKHSITPAPLITKLSTLYDYNASQAGVKFGVKALAIF
jgi:hypothetical protein